MTGQGWVVWLPWALLLLWGPGCSSLSGPTSVTGTVGGSLSVQCQYEEKFREIAKYWCKRPCVWSTLKTKDADREVRSGRVSIRDHPANLTFTVTLESLTEDDAGTYRCGIDTSGLPGFVFDHTFRVVVSVTPGPSSVRPTSTPGLHRTQTVPTWGTATLQETPNSSQHPGSCTYLPTPRRIVEVLPSARPSLESHPAEDQAPKGAERSLLSSIYFWVVLLLLSLLSAVL